MLGTGMLIGVEPAMFFGLGFLASTLIAVIAVGLVHSRAVRLTTQRLDSVNPVSMKSIQAEKDMMRAEFAMTARRLESSIDELKSKTTAHVNELTKKSNVIARLKQTLDERSAAIVTLEGREAALELREKTLFEELQAAKADIAFKTDTLMDLERTLAAAKSEIADLHIAVEQRTHLIERQCIEIAALKSHIDVVRHQVAVFANDVRASEDRLAHEWVDLKSVKASAIANGSIRLQAQPNGNGAHAPNGANGLAPV
jgi:chromosome segregation ATPase